MTSELLPQWLNLFLDDFESSICFVILVLMVFCTSHLLCNQLFDIGITVYQRMAKPSEAGRKSFDVVQRVKRIFGFGQSNPQPPENTVTTAAVLGSEMRIPDEEWDYCDEDYD